MSLEHTILWDSPGDSSVSPLFRWLNHVNLDVHGLVRDYISVFGDIEHGAEG